MKIGWERPVRRPANEPHVLGAIIAIFILVGLYAYNDRISTNPLHSRETLMRMALVGALGGPCIPVIAQCCTSRNLSEGIYARRSDLPGGYCSHSDCDVVYTGAMNAEKHYTLKIKKLGKRD
ncbi:MAG: hypothetical protein AB2L11_03260 [Syntrophobacteraceae bacterium]